MTTMLDRWKELAVLENARMLEMNGNPSAYLNITKRRPSGPRMYDINQSKVAKQLLQVARAGGSMRQAAQECELTLPQVRVKAARYNIIFEADDD